MPNDTDIGLVLDDMKKLPPNVTGTTIVPSSADLGPHIVRDFIGEINFTAPANWTSSDAANYTDFVSYLNFAIQLVLWQQMASFAQCVCF